MFTSKYNLKILPLASYIFINATFKLAPKDFYQILNILIFIENDKFTMPVCHVLMTNKSF